MKAVVKTNSAYGADYVDVERPRIHPNEILVKVHATSICGTDLQIYKSRDWTKERVRLPMILGHEFAGVVVERGCDVKNVDVGNIISAETHLFCNECYQCTNNKRNVCEDTKILGIDVDGSFAEYIKIPARNAWVHSKELPLEILCLYEPLGNAVHAVLDENIAGKSVAVLGCGPAGLFSIAIAKKCGAKSVVAVEPNDYRLGIAKKLGAGVCSKPENVDCGKVDVVLEMSGNNNAINMAADLVSNGGVINWFGIPHNKFVEIKHSKLINKGVRCNYIIGRKIWDSWHKLEALIEKIDLNPVITHKMKLEDFKQGMEIMERQECGKIILYP